MLIELILFIWVAFLLWTLCINTKGKNRPPGPLQFPVVGTLIQLFKKMKTSNRELYVALEKFSVEYGKVSTVKLGLQEMVLVNDLDMIKEMLSSEAWVDRNFDLLHAMRSFDKPYGVLFACGEEWKEMRRFTLRTLRDFGFGKHKNQESVYQEEIEELMKRVDAGIDSNKGSYRVNMEQFFTISGLNIVWSLVGGERFSHSDPKLLKMNHMTSVAVKAMAPGKNILKAFSTKLFRYFLIKFSSNFKFIQSYLGFMHQFFLDILKERRALGYYKEDQRDFIDVFLKEIDIRKDTGSSTKPNFYHDKQFLTVMLDLFEAGSETTSNTLEFAFLYMILNPHVQRKVQQEIHAVVGRNAYPSYATHRNIMPYTEATIHEIQRMACILPLDNRNTNQDTMLGGYFIKKGTAAILNFYSVHYNKGIWGDPLVFRPERFLDSENNVVNTNKLLSYGGGKRMCLGETVARATLFNYFTRMLQKYNFEVVPDTPLPIATPRIGVTLSPNPYDVVISYSI